jgi:hypothetical protein
MLPRSRKLARARMGKGKEAKEGEKGGQAQIFYLLNRKE